ncbi:MAG: DUF2235 domain-containing protein [Thainema sp.]
MKKRLIVCCDGTWQDLGNSTLTNVAKFAQAIASIGQDGTPQIVFYDEGIGTELTSNILSGGAFGRGIDYHIQEAYGFLALNYNPGDEIYLLGFSRGAYTVRSLAGFIYNSGLLKRERINQITEAYENYRDRTLHPDQSPELVKFRRDNGERVPVKFLGCWDTVGSLGLPNLMPFLPIRESFNQRYAFHDHKLSDIIEHARHAIAIDEPRQSLSVTPMEQGEAVKQTQTLKQVWFPGDHGCVGGGTPEYRGFSDAALEWMMQQASELGLALKPEYIADGIQPDHAIAFTPHSPLPWMLLGGYKPRQLNPERGDHLHPITIQRWQELNNYRPHNLLHAFGTLLNNQFCSPSCSTVVQA